MDDSTLLGQTHINPITNTDEPVDFIEGISPTPDVVKGITPAITETPGSKSSEKITSFPKTTPFPVTTPFSEIMEMDYQDKKESAITYDARLKEVKQIAESTPPPGEADELRNNEGLLTTYDRLKNMTAVFQNIGMKNLAFFTAGAALALGPKILEMKYGIHIEGMAKMVADMGPGAFIGSDYGEKKIKPISRIADKVMTNEPTPLQHKVIEAGDIVSGAVAGAILMKSGEELARLANIPKEAVPFFDDAGIAGLRIYSKLGAIKHGVGIARNFIKERFVRTNNPTGESLKPVNVTEQPQVANAVAA